MVRRGAAQKRVNPPLSCTKIRPYSKGKLAVRRSCLHRGNQARN
jgi:hypothetical protein